MKKEIYIGMIDYKGVNWVRIEGADVSQMTGVKGVDYLILENVKGLQGVLDFRGVKTVEFRNTDVTGIKAIQCKMNFDIKGLKDDKDPKTRNKLSSLMIYEPVNPVAPNVKLIKDYIYKTK